MTQPDTLNTANVVNGAVLVLADAVTGQAVPDLVTCESADIRAVLTRLAAVEQALRDISEVLDGAPDYHYQGMGCGLEDRNITDRYDAMEYGWDQAVERVYSEHVNGAKEIADNLIEERYADEE